MLVIGSLIGKVIGYDALPRTGHPEVNMPGRGHPHAHTSAHARTHRHVNTHICCHGQRSEVSVDGLGFDSRPRQKRMNSFFLPDAYIHLALNRCLGVRKQ